MEYVRQVDIIIPVYNAYDSLNKCVESVLSNTDCSFARVVLVEDKSTDERILPYLKEIALRNDQVVLLENTQNMGFVRSVNRALEQAPEDVVLLNSDTIVPHDWLRQLQKAAFSSAVVGTVTPLSNNGSHCTIPLFACEGDTLEETIARTQERVQMIGLQSYPDIGVGVGFCMYIRKEALNAVGLLDADRFGHGYGEEVDFCLKAEQMGYRNILCDDLFVYHEGTASFSLKTKNQNMSAGDKVIKKQYPEQFTRVLQIAAEAEQSDWYKNIELYRSISNNRKNILYLVHADFRMDASNNVGGTQFHVKDLTAGLKERYNIFVMARDRDSLRLSIYIDEKRMSFKFYIGNAPQFTTFHDPFQRELYLDILKAFHIDVVHIHHTYSLTLDLYHAARELSIPLLASLHDYYTVCPTIFLLENRTDFCGDRCGQTNCRECLEVCNQVSSKLDYISKWREEHLEALKKCDQIFAPSNSARKTVLQYYPELANKIKVIPHGVDMVAETYEQTVTLTVSDDVYFNIESNDTQLACGNLFGWAYLKDHDSTASKIYLILSSEGKENITVPVSAIQRDDLAGIDPRYGKSGFAISFPVNTLKPGQWNVHIAVRNGDRYCKSKIFRSFCVADKKEKTLNVAFIGGLSEPKGSRSIYKMIKQGGKNINWFLFGGIGDRELAMLEQPNLFKTSWYQRENLKQLFDLYSIDLVCILPAVAETFCYTLSEAVCCNCPVLVSDIGALGERMREMGCGWILPVNATTKERLDKIEEIRLNPEILAAAKESVIQYNHRSVSEMASDYASVYEKYPTRKEPMGQVYDTKRLYHGYLIGEHISGAGTGHTQVLQDRIDCLEKQIAMIEDSSAYKAAMALRRMRIPFKNTLKRMAFFCYRIAKKLHVV